VIRWLNPAARALVGDCRVVGIFGQVSDVDEPDDPPPILS
jgi:hypothetical protein